MDLREFILVVFSAGSVEIYGSRFFVKHETEISTDPNRHLIPISRRLQLWRISRIQSVTDSSWDMDMGREMLQAETPQFLVYRVQ